MAAQKTTFRYQGEAAARLTLPELVDELVDGWTTREVVTQPALRPGADPASCAWPRQWDQRTRTHAVHHAPLLEQLAPGLTSSSSTEDSVSRSAAECRFW